MIDLPSVLLSVLQHFEHLPPIDIDWVDLDEVSGRDWTEGGCWGCCIWRGGRRYIGVSPELRRAPLYVVRYLVFHEVLHVALPPKGRCVHHRAFRVAERLWPDFVRANDWLDARV